jgi:hypothetical protein
MPRSATAPACRSARLNGMSRAALPACANCCKLMVNTMSNDWDTELTRAFAQVRKSALGDDRFTATLLSDIERARRSQLWRRIFAIATVVVIASLNLRPLLEKTAAAVRWAGELSPGAADMLITPRGWAVSMLIGAWVLLRTRPSRR